MTWRNAEALLCLRAELDAAFPGRDRASDGGIGNVAHSTRTSDHNPWVVDANGIGVVRAFDFDAGPGLLPDEAHDTAGDVLCAAVVAAARARHPAMTYGSYIIYERTIYSYTYGFEARPYNGTNPHDSHVHVSVGRARAAYDSRAAWGVRAPVVLPVVDASNIYPGAPKHGHVVMVQQGLNRVMGAALTCDGLYGPNTTAVARGWQERLYGTGQGVDGDLGLDSLTKLGAACGLFRAVA